jgi:hypothetical protein
LDIFFWNGVIARVSISDGPTTTTTTCSTGKTHNKFFPSSSSLTPLGVPSTNKKEEFTYSTNVKENGSADARPGGGETSDKGPAVFLYSKWETKFFCFFFKPAQR